MLGARCSISPADAHGPRDARRLCLLLAHQRRRRVHDGSRAGRRERARRRAADAGVVGGDWRHAHRRDRGAVQLDGAAATERRPRGAHREAQLRGGTPRRLLHPRRARGDPVPGRSVQPDGACRARRPGAASPRRDGGHVHRPRAAHPSVGKRADAAGRQVDVAQRLFPADDHPVPHQRTPQRSDLDDTHRGAARRRVAARDGRPALCGVLGRGRRDAATQRAGAAAHGRRQHDRAAADAGQSDRHSDRAQVARRSAHLRPGCGAGRFRGAADLGSVVSNSTYHLLRQHFDLQLRPLGVPLLLARDLGVGSIPNGPHVSIAYDGQHMLVLSTQGQPDGTTRAVAQSFFFDGRSAGTPSSWAPMRRRTTVIRR